MMKIGRALILLGALLLLATAAVHGAGSSMVSSWLEGERRSILMLAWFTFSIDWVVVALIWIYCGWRGDPRYRLIIFAASIIPSATAIGLTVTVGPTFFGVWMLLAAAGLAILGALRINEPAGSPSRAK